MVRSFSPPSLHQCSVLRVFKASQSYTEREKLSSKQGCDVTRDPTRDLAHWRPRTSQLYHPCSLRSWCWLWSAQDRVFNPDVNRRNDAHTKNCHYFLWALLLKSTLLILLVFTRYWTIFKHTESEKSLHGVLQELWYNIPSDTITSLRAHNRLPSTDPDVVNILRQFDYPFNFHTNYGQRLTGYLQVRSSNIIFSIIFGRILCSKLRT